MNERVYMDPAQNAGLGGRTDVNNIDLRDGSLRGDFGPRVGFDGPATQMQGSSDPQFGSTVTISREEGDRGTGMVILWTNGIVLEQLPDGVHEFEYDPQSISNDQAIALNVCSGTDPNNIDYDQPASRGTVTVAQNPEGGRLVQIHTETDILDGAGNATGEFETADVEFTLAR